MIKTLEELEAEAADFDQCRYGLKSVGGGFHLKPTRVATSSPALASRLHGQKCMRTHAHDPVLGGARVTRPAGHYLGQLARCMVIGMESQFDLEGKKMAEVNAVEDGDMEDDEDLDDGTFAQHEVPGHSESEDEGENPPPGMKITAGIRQAVRRLHENTGHRSNKRLARALIVSGAPPEVVWAARHHQCDVCKEKVLPKSRRPASLPTPKDCGVSR